MSLPQSKDGRFAIKQVCHNPKRLSQRVRMKLPPFTTALTCDTYRDKLGKRCDAGADPGPHGNGFLGFLRRVPRGTLVASVLVTPMRPAYFRSFPGSKTGSTTQKATRPKPQNSSVFLEKVARPGGLELAPRKLFASPPGDRHRNPARVDAKRRDRFQQVDLIDPNRSPV
jgi:hypothetical protein